MPGRLQQAPRNSIDGIDTRRCVHGTGVFFVPRKQGSLYELRNTPCLWAWGISQLPFTLLPFPVGKGPGTGLPETAAHIDPSRTADYTGLYTQRSPGAASYYEQ